MKVEKLLSKAEKQVYHTKKSLKALAFNDFCGTTRIRTGDTRIFSPMLYQLSYGTN